MYPGNYLLRILMFIFTRWRDLGLIIPPSGI
jgi:hypothetical protein